MIDTMKQALDALEYIYTETTEEEDKLIHAAITGLRLAIEQAEKQEPVAWKNAAIRLGEELSSVGPDGYYDMTAEQWLSWAMDTTARPGGLAQEAAAELRRLHEEDQENARIIGMGAERELRLRAQVDELERALGIAGKALRLSIECHRCGRYIADV